MPRLINHEDTKYMHRFRIFKDEGNWRPYCVMGMYRDPSDKMGVESHWQQISPFFSILKNAEDWAKKNGYKLEED